MTLQKRHKNLAGISEGAILVTADVVGLNPSTLHEARVEALKKTLNERDRKSLFPLSADGRICFEKTVIFSLMIK